MITAGPTWVPIDNVRVISNLATGATGRLLAEKLLSKGAKVTLLLGPAGTCCLNKKIRLIPFKFFDELKAKITRELKAKKYDIFIHAAAVADYRPQKSYRQKIKSHLNRLQLKLVATPKIIDGIKKIDPQIFLVGFKFDPQAEKKQLIAQAKTLAKRANLDLVVANSINKGAYQAYILNHKNIYGPLRNKNALARELIKVVGKTILNY